MERITCTTLVDGVDHLDEAELEAALVELRTDRELAQRLLAHRLLGEWLSRRMDPTRSGFCERLLRLVQPPRSSRRRALVTRQRFHALRRRFRRLLRKDPRA